MKLPETMFSITPEALNAIDTMRATHELAPPVIDSKVLSLACIYQTVVAAPSIRVDHHFGHDATANNGLQRGLFADRHGLRVNAPVALEEAEDDSLATRRATALAPHAPSAEVRLIDFNFAGREG